MLKTTTGPIGLYPEEQNSIGSMVTEILSFRRTYGRIDRQISFYFVLQISWEGGDIWLNYTSPQSCIITFSYSLAQQLQGHSGNFKLSVQTFEPPIVIYRRNNFMYNQWGCSSNYRPLSYPFRSLKLRQICIIYSFIQIY